MSRSRTIRELPVWVKVIGPWVPLLVLLLVAFYVFTLTPSSMFASPLYLGSFVVWVVLGRLILPVRQAIPGHRKVRRPVIGWGAFAMIGAAVYLLAKVESSFVPVVDAWAGFPFGMALFGAYELPRNERVRYCEKCQTHKAFLKYKGHLFCSVCGTRFDAATVPKNTT